MRFFYCTIVFLFMLILTSCAQLFFETFEVENCIFSEKNVTINFSSIPNQYLFMKNFTIKEDSVEMTGAFEFCERQVIFTPDYGIKNNYYYELIITSSMEDIGGNSLEKDYKKTFTTRTDFVRPEVIEVYPAHESELVSELDEITIKFSEPIDDCSFRTALSFSPSFGYVYKWEDSDRIVKIYPTEKLAKETRYEIKLATSLKDKNRNSLLKEYRTTFINFMDRDIPDFDVYLKSNGKQVKIDKNIQITNINTDEKLNISFSEKMDIDYISSYISIFPALNMTITPDKKSKDKAVIEFNNDMIWGETYRLTVKKGLKDLSGNEITTDCYYDLTFNNENKRPIRIRKVLIDLKTDDYTELRNFGTLSFDPTHYSTSDSDPVPTDIIFVFEISKNATHIVDFSVMENFSAEALNACLDELMIKKVKILDDAEIMANIKLKKIYDSIIDIEGKICIVNIGLEIVNSSQNNNGILKFFMGDGVKDSLGNTLIEEYSCQINKI